MIKVDFIRKFIKIPRYLGKSTDLGFRGIPNGLGAWENTYLENPRDLLPYIDLSEHGYLATHKDPGDVERSGPEHMRIWTLGT